MDRNGGRNIGREVVRKIGMEDNREGYRQEGRYREKK